MTSLSLYGKATEPVPHPLISRSSLFNGGSVGVTGYVKASQGIVSRR